MGWASLNWEKVKALDVSESLLEDCVVWCRFGRKGEGGARETRACSGRPSCVIAGPRKAHLRMA